ncbi:MAG: DUF2231 domain-containing protein [Thermodesulfobacteriota bacterium]
MNFIYHLLEGLGYTHPLHPPLAHMPIGLVVGALVLGLAGWWLKRPNWIVAARYCVALALIFLILATVAGYLDWQHYYAGAWLWAIKIKIILTGVLLIFLVMAVIWGRKAGGGAQIYLSLYTLCFVAVIGLGYYGGQLVLSGTCTPPSEKPTAGAKIYHTYCGACHPYGGNILNPKLPIIGSPQMANFSDFLAYNRKPKRSDGVRAIMPAFSQEKISDQDMEELFNYINESVQRLR